MTNTSFAHWKTICQLLGCDVSILVNNGISMLQHFRTNSYDRTAWARQIMQLCSPCSRSHYSFCPVTNSTSVDCSTATSTGKMLGGISHWWFNGNKELHHSSLFILTITDQPVVRPCCSGAICQKYLWLHTQMLETSNLFHLKSQVPSFVTGKKTKTKTKKKRYFLGNLCTWSFLSDSAPQKQMFWHSGEMCCHHLWQDNLVYVDAKVIHRAQFYQLWRRVSK